LTKVIAKARATSKRKQKKKASQRAYFAFQEKWIENNTISKL
jgi:ribonuclease-3